MILLQLHLNIITCILILNNGIQHAPDFILLEWRLWLGLRLGSIPYSGLEYHTLLILSNQMDQSNLSKLS